MTHPLLDELAARGSARLSEQQRERLNRFLGLLLDANRRMNLTGITDRAAAEVNHLADSLTLLPHLPAGAITIADVGTGGGVPGIPLAIARPDAQVVLIESTKKKATFLRETVTQLDLKNVTVLDQRAEAVGAIGSERRERFDVVVARAVATLNWLVEWCLPLAKVGGKMLAMKGPKVREELPIASRAIKLLGGGEVTIHPVKLAAVDERVIVEIPKRSRTPRTYPRDPTVAKGKPII